MTDWLFDLPVVWMALLVFGVTYFVAASIYGVVVVLATGERAFSRRSRLACCRR